MLTTVNLGDSGYMILRKNSQTSLDILYQSKEQQHSFNFPFQVGTNGDDPESGESNAHNVQHNDIIVIGSDGLWDNMHRPKIVDMFQKYIKTHDIIHDHVQHLAEAIALEAEKYSYQQRYMSPFAESARAQRQQYSGGKPDDITVVVA